jgi:hypothetical protein
MRHALSNFLIVDASLAARGGTVLIPAYGWTFGGASIARLRGARGLP